MPKKSHSIKLSDKKGDKPWLRKVKPHSYAVNSRNKNKSFLIVCEGQTEELYFKSFPVLSATVRSVQTGCSKIALVRTVERYKKEGHFDEIWCVFDMDADPMIKRQKEDFNNAIQLAHSLGYHCAYSNDSFELWFVLHYMYCEQEYLRDFYNSFLTVKWNVNYDDEGKSYRFASKIYDRLLKDQGADQAKAIQRAKKLAVIHEGKPKHQQNPVTLAFLLVEKLNLHCRA